MVFFYFTDNKPEKCALLRFLSFVTPKLQEIGNSLGIDSIQVCVLKNETGQYIVPLQVDKDTIPFMMINDIEVLKGENAIY